MCVYIYRVNPPTYGVPALSLRGGGLAFTRFICKGDTSTHAQGTDRVSPVCCPCGCARMWLLACSCVAR